MIGLDCCGRCDGCACHLDGFHEISEEDFYPPKDDRVLASGIEDIDGDMGFYEYSEWFYDTYGEDLFDDGYLL